MKNPEFSSEEQSMQQQTQQVYLDDPVGFEEAEKEEPVESDSAAEAIADPVIFARLESEVYSIAFSPDGRKIIAGLGNGTLQLFDAISGKPIGKPFQGHGESVASVAFSPDGKTIVSGSEDNTLRLWDLQGNPIGKPLQGHKGWVASVAFSPNGKAIVSGSEDNTLRLWDLQGTQIGQPFKGHERGVLSVAFSPDGKAIVSGSDNQTLRLWDLQGNPIGQPFQGHDYSVLSVAFSPDGKTIVSGSFDQTLRLWDLQGNQIGLPFLGHENVVLSVAFSPDGKAIVSGSHDHTLRLWDLQGNPIGQPFLGHGNSVLSVAFSPDGKAIVSGSFDGTLRLWDLQGNSISSRKQIIEIPQGIANDSAQGEDCLNVRDEIEALTTVLMLRSLQPPIAVAILGSWGSGKSFGMHLIQQRIEEIRRQELTRLQAWGDPLFPNDTQIMSPYVGHIYQISFNAWTYAKSDLWASLMQEIFYELNRQITLERQIGIFLSDSPAPQENKEEKPESISSEKLPSNRNIDRLIYNPFKKLKETIQTSIKYFQTAIVILSLKILNIWIVQFVLHIITFVLIILFIVFISYVKPFDSLTNKKFDIVSKIDNSLFIEWLGEKFRAYYFPNNLKTSYKSWREGIESVIEHLLFLLLDGFPKRLKDSKKNLETFKKSKTPEPKPANLEPKPVTNFKLETDLNQQKEFEQALLNGGEFWRVLYLSNDEERRAFIESNDRLKKFKDPTSNSNYLWNTLDQSKHEEQQRLKEQEKELQKKEQELQRQLKTAEAEVKQQLANRKATALWTPIVKVMMRLLFSKEEIEKYNNQIEKLAEAGKTTNETIALIRKVATSWQGLIALFLMTFMIALTLNPETQTAISSATQNWLKQTGLAELFESVRTQIPSGVQIFTAIVAFVTTLIPILKTLSNYLNSVQKEQAKIQGDREFLLKQKQSDAEPIVKEIAQLKLQVAEQRQRVGITANYASLMDFVSDRLQVDDYGRRLGQMQQVKQDLAALSDRLTDWQHNREELKKFFPRGSARVVLYIDDLDRCPPDRVVEVLESVQLLLNTKLFIVVLGIDDRYIARALEQVYKGVLKRGGKPSGLDYLEKIIQIPYRMRPISSSQIESYFEKQLIVRKPEPKPDTVAQETDTKTLLQAIEKNDLEPINTTDEVPATEQSKIDVPESLENGKSSATSETLSSLTVTSESTKDSQNLTPQADSQSANSSSQPTSPPSFLETIAQTIEFKEEEFQLLVNCCKHVDITPRTAKRLINIYKILQIIWSTRSQKTSTVPTDEDDRNKRIITMSFLALSGRYPTYMRNLFEEIDVLFEETVDEDKPLEIDLEKLLEPIQPTTENDRYAQREWRKFTSDIKRMLEQDEANPSKLTIDRDVFDLMLSFCFVGDIGYDPDDFESKV